jgi:hypothetical protein
VTSRDCLAVLLMVTIALVIIAALMRVAELYPPGTGPAVEVQP